MLDRDDWTVRTRNYEVTVTSRLSRDFKKVERTEEAEKMDRLSVRKKSRITLQC